MTTRNPALPANALADWAEASLPGDRYVYHKGRETLDKPHDRVFGAARKLAEGGLFVLFTLPDHRVIVRVSDRAARFLKAAASW